MITQQLAKNALEFLSRVNLNATEVNAFIEVGNALHAIANPQPLDVKIPGEISEELKDAVN